MALHFQHLLASLQQTSPPSYLLALSGGLDSCVLLDLMHKITANTHIPLRAIHIHHGLQNEADQWSQHCEQLCESLNIPLKVVHLNMQMKKGESLEASAREQRYHAFASELLSDELLLLAQHRDDQAETLLLQLLRGAGPEGLASMPVNRKFAAGIMCRPLLETNRVEIEAYASQHSLHWIEDPSNQDTAFDRNYLRHNIMPRLKQRWPSYSKTISRSARLCGVTNSLIQTQAAALLSEISVGDLHPEKEGCLNTQLLVAKKLGQLSPQQQAIVVREWLRQQHHASPTETQLQQVLMQMLVSSVQASPCVAWANVEVRRYRTLIYALESPQVFDSVIQYPWDLKRPLELRGLNECLVACDVIGEGISQKKLTGLSLVINFRYWNPTEMPGADHRPESRVKASKLKKIMQQMGVPPWLRSRVPILSSQGKLIALVGWWVAPAYRSLENETGVIIKRQPLLSTA